MFAPRAAILAVFNIVDVLMNFPRIAVNYSASSRMIRDFVFIVPFIKN